MMFADKSNRAGTYLKFIAIFVLIAGYLSDGAYKYIMTYQLSEFRISILIRGLSMFLFFTYLLFNYKKIRVEFLLLLLLLTCVTAIGHYHYYEITKGNYDYKESINLFFKYIFTFVIFYSFIDIDKKSFSGILKIYELIIIINCILAISGLFFKIEFLKSYVWQWYRFGYNGLIYAQNESTQFYFLALVYATQLAFVQKKKLWFFTLVVIASLLCGTKALLIIDVSLFLFIALTYGNTKQKIALIFLLIFVVSSISIILYTDSFRQYTDIFIRIYNEHGLLTMLLSHRDLLFQFRFPYVTGQWEILNYLFGGHDITRNLIELDYIDLFLYFGVIGTLIFIWMQCFTIFSEFRKTPLHVYFVLTYIGISFLAGHFLASAVNSLYLVLLVFHLHFQSLNDTEPTAR